MSREIIEAVKTIERERGLEEETLLNAIEDGLAAAYKKMPGAERLAAVELDDECDFRVFAYDIPEDLYQRLLDEAREQALDDLEARETEAKERGEKTSLTLVRDDDLQIDWEQVPEDQIKRRDVTPTGFGRIAAMTARQVIQQRLREAERLIAFEDYKDRVGEMVLGIVRQSDNRSGVYVDLGRTEALLPRSEQIPGERYETNTRVRALIIDVRAEGSGPMVILSRKDPWLVAELFSLEVPEIADGIVEVKAVARDPGMRAKILVQSHQSGVDPVGACVGPRGARVRPVVSELRGEKIDIIPWQDDPARAIARALQPARVSEVYVDEEKKEAIAVVPEDQRALAIGKEGSNVRLASRLMGWKIAVQSAVEFAEAEQAGEDRGEGDSSGRCAAILSSGKRCPNAALPGLNYCGIPGHQELASKAVAAAEAAAVAAATAEAAAATEAEAGAASAGSHSEPVEAGAPTTA